MANPEVIRTDIAGVLMQPLSIIPTQGGPVLHMLKPDYPLAPSGPLGEIYFSEVLPGYVKAWKRHKRQTQRFSVPVGRIRIVLFDDRPDSGTRLNLLNIELGRPDAYRLLLIPPLVWYGFQGTSEYPALICNYADLPHSPEEGERLPKDSSAIPFTW